MKTFTLKAKTHTPAWLIIDADGVVLGRLATVAARHLIGKNKPHYTPHMLSGDIVIVTNAAKLRVTGNKLVDKRYYNHSGYPGGLREMTLEQKLAKDPTEVVRLAVRGMLPKNKLAGDMLKNLKVFPGAEHPHEAQQPTQIKAD